MELAGGSVGYFVPYQYRMARGDNGETMVRRSEGGKGCRIGMAGKGGETSLVHTAGLLAARKDSKMRGSTSCGRGMGDGKGFCCGR